MGSPLRLTVVGIPEPRAAAAWAAVSAAFEELEQALSAVPAHERPRDPQPAGRRSRRAPRSTRACTRPWRPRSEPGAGPEAPSTRASSAISNGSATAAPGFRDEAGLPGARHRRGEAPARRAATFADGRWLSPRAAAAGAGDRRPDRPRRDRQGPGAPVGIRGPAGSAARDRGRRRRRGRCERRPAGRRRAPRGRRRSRRPGRRTAAGTVAGRDRASPAPTTRSRSSRSTAAPSAPRRLRVHAWTAADGRAVHHLVDPRTGEPGGDGLLAVTVAGPDPAWAEVWSKTLFLEGAARDRPAGAGAGPRGLVDPRRRAPGDDAGRAAADGLARRRGLTRGVRRPGRREAPAVSSTRCGTPRRRR